MMASAIGITNLEIIKKEINEVDVGDFGVLLPQLGNATQGVYTIVTKNWSTSMFGEYNFQSESSNYQSSVEGYQHIKQEFNEDCGYI